MYADNEKQKEYQRKRAAACRAAYLSDKRCAKCGSDIDLELDHIDPPTKVSHSVWSWSEEKRKTELAKCQVLCAECHKKKTAAAYRAKRQHGTKTMYNNARCRCGTCRRFHADQAIAWRKRTGRH